MYKKILLAVDIEKDNKNLLAKAIRMAKCNEAEIEVVYVSQMVMIDNTFDLSSATFISPADNEESREILAGIVETITAAGIKAHGRIVEGLKIAPTIIDQLYEEIGYDLIICGSNNRSEISEFFLGSVSKQIADHAKTDVYIIKG